MFAAANNKFKKTLHAVVNVRRNPSAPELGERKPNKPATIH